MRQTQSEPQRMRWLSGAVAACCLIASAPVGAQEIEQIVVQGDPTKRWIEDDDLGFYYHIPSDKQLELYATGPGTLIMFLVNHRVESDRAMSVLAVQKNGRAWKRLKLGCAPIKERFTAGKTILPCARLTRDLRLGAGQQRLGFRMARTRWGASVHFLFVPQGKLDTEPELVTSIGGGEGEDWQEADGVEDPGLDLAAIGPIEAPTEPTAKRTSGPDFSNPLVWLAVGLGVAAAGTGGYFGWRSSSLFLDAARDDVTQLDRRSLNDDGRRSAVIANTLFGVAAAGLVTGGLFLFLGGSPGEDGAKTASRRNDGEPSTIKWGFGACGTF